MRNIVVTGGGTGIGLAVAARFASQGDSVTITGRRTDVLTEAANTLGARAVAFDASDPDAVTAALPALPDRVDVLINNAGGNVGFDLPAHDKDDLTGLAREWRANLATNVLSAVLVTTALTPRLADDGRVIMVGSIAARTGAGSYGASKAALEAWTIDVATRLGPRGITANLVSPGLIEDTEFFRGRLSDQRRATLISRTATGRAGAPDDIAATCAFLASPGAGHLTGQVLHVNGGAHFGR